MIKRYTFLCFLLLLPLLYINVRDSHDWGDDFAQYLLQAKNIVKGIPQVKNGLVFDSRSGEYALKAYPVGFPLLLAPVYHFSELSVRPFLLLISSLLIILGVLFFRYLRKNMEAWLALPVVLLFAYNPWTLAFKAEILSEIPFTCFVFILIWFHSFIQKKPTLINYLLAGMFCGWIASVRAVGWVAVPSLLLALFFSKPDDPETKKISSWDKLVFSVTALAGAVFFFFFLNAVIFSIPLSGFFGFYSKAMQEHETILWTNLVYYKDLSRYIFPLPLIHQSLPPSWLLLPAAGLVIRLIKHRSLEEWFVIFYTVVILLYPYNAGGFRFLLPIFPFLIRYLAGALNALLELSATAWKTPILQFVLLILLAGYIGPVKDLLDRQAERVQGPQQPAAREMFEYFRDHAGEEDVLVFCKARAMSLYTGHHAAYLVAGQEPAETDAMFRRMGVHYLVVAKAKQGDELYDEKMMRYLGQFGNQYSVTWENSDFRVLSRPS